jgi:hypothetical protein
LQLVQERAGCAWEAIGTGKDLLSKTPATNRKDGKMALHEIKKLCTTTTTKGL